jgi:hypothetical protein
VTRSLLLGVRDLQLLEALATKVRLMSLRQIAQHWWKGDLTNARRRLRALTSAQLTARLEVRARDLPAICQPVTAWCPGDAEADPGQVAHLLQSRWRSRPVRSVAVFVATERTAQICGGRVGQALKRPLQATHDLGVAAVWLALRASAPDWAEAWRSEDLLAHTRRGEKCPDAFLVREQQIVRVVEFGGAYDAQRVRAFHADCQKRNLPYQIW